MLNDYNTFLLEKRIDQISTNVSITFGFDVIKTKHAEDRSNFSKRGLGGENQRHISNAEMKWFVNYFISEISTGIAIGDIIDEQHFVIKSKDKGMSMAIIARKVSNAYWKLVIKTVFRESETNQLYVSKNQVVFEK